MKAQFVVAQESFADMYLKFKRISYIGCSTTNKIIMNKGTPIDGNSTTGNTTINCVLTVTGNFTYTGGGSYTQSEIDDRLELQINTPLGHICTKLKKR